MASSTDVIGPIARSVGDAALVLDVIAGQDSKDSTTLPASQDFTRLHGSLKGKKVGIIKEYFDEGLDPGVRSCIETAIETLKEAGAEVSEVSLPSLPLALAVYYVICPAEVSSNLSRYDGQRFGHHKSSARDLLESYEEARAEGFGAEAKRRIMIGTYVLSSGYYDAYYKKAALVRTKLINEFNEAFGKFDLLVGPTAPEVAFKIGENTNDPLKMYLTDIMTVAANLAGIPAISVPAGESEGMPVGLQLMAQRGSDLALLSAAKMYEDSK